MLEVHARRHILADPYQEVMALVSRHPCAEVVGVVGAGVVVKVVKVVKVVEVVEVVEVVGVVGVVGAPPCFPQQRLLVELMECLTVVPGRDSRELLRVTGFQDYPCQQLDDMFVPHVTQDRM